MTTRILALIECTDALAAMLQTLRLEPTTEHAHRVCLQLHAMAHACEKLAGELTKDGEL